MVRFDWTETRDVYIGFREGHSWFSRTFLAKGYGHCYGLINDGYNWIYINPEHSYLKTEILNVLPSVDLPRQLINHDHRMIKLKLAKDVSERVWKRLGLLNCVEQIKYWCGLRVKAYTPRQLHRCLLNMNEKACIRQGIRQIQPLV